MAFFRVLLPALFGMVAAAPAAHVDVQVRRPAPDEPGETREETVSITFRAVDYRPAFYAELRIEIDEDAEDGDPPVDAEADEAAPPRARPARRGPDPHGAPAAAPRRADVRAGRLALPPPTLRA